MVAGRETRAWWSAAVWLCAGPVFAQDPESAAAPGNSASGPTDDRPRVTLPTVLVPGKRPIDVGPLPGLAITKDQIPANIQSATKEEIKASRALNIGDYMNAQMQGVSANDYAGNPFQLDINYRGFTASPQVGTPQGLSVFFDGVRVNEPFGDVVNWDLIPVNAIDRFDLFPGSNPLFGLNTLGGAISVRTKNGYTAPGIEASLIAGSWGRSQESISAGWHGDTLAGFAAINVFDEKGWRDNSPSRVRQAYARGDWVLDRGTLNASVLWADNKLIGNGLIPIELYDERPETVFTSPDRSKNRLLQFTLGGEFDVSETWNLTARAYRRSSDREGTAGDIYEGFEDMDAEHDSIPDPNVRYSTIARNGAHQFGGNFSNYGGPGVVDGTPIGLFTNTTLSQVSTGLALQSSWNLPEHKIMAGASIDRNESTYLMSQRLGLIDAAHQVYLAPDRIDPQYYAASHDVPGNNFSGTSTTKSLYASETWSVKPNLHLTVAARANWTSTDSDLDVRTSEGSYELHELRTGTNGLPERLDPITTTKEGFFYRSFNPSAGVNWLPDPDLNLYANLSRGARTPSVVELGCAYDGTPVPFVLGQTNFGSIPASLRGPGCNLPTTLSGDPYLPQIRSTSGEVGARGRLAGRWNWSASIYRTDLTDDIYFVGVGDNRSYFDTIGKTRRQGLELGLDGSIGAFDVKLGYSYTDATFESTFYTVSPHNSSANFDQNSQPFYLDVTTRLLLNANSNANQGRGTYLMTRVDPGARLPGIPQHAFNARLQWRASSDIKLGLGMVARSSSFVRGNENNQHQPSGNDQQIGLYYCNDHCVSGGYQQIPVGPGRDFHDDGEVPGYAIFNLDGTWQATKRLAVGFQVTNLFDRKYYTAGRLGINPFAPSVNGAIGPSGWNYNSTEWQNTTFVGPGAPRGLFLNLTYAYDAK
ncbi:MAG: TonB-dependent receptor [Proteobacteria bacterium]|nr:TonB-dependent receptor [Pseudomonadota bacterium]